MQGMRVESVRRILDAAQTMMDELARAAPDDLELQRSRAAMLTEFATTYLRAGDLTRARAGPRRASRSCASLPPPIRAMRAGSAT